MTNRILLVDDNLTNLQVLYQALEAEGYELLVAQSGAEALEIAREAQPQLVLLDITMPGMDGYETCHKLKADEATADAVVVYLSARGDVADKLEGFEAGAVDFISKPFQFKEVVARVRAHLDSYHERAELRNKASELERRLEGGFHEFDETSLTELIAKGEGAKLEFKSTLRMNLYSKKSDKRMENACLKTIAAFLNTAGGILIVGVDDEGLALGLEADKFPNEDKLLLHLTSMIRSYLGAEVATYLQSSIHDFSHQRILVMQCLPSPSPVFFNRENNELFYVRLGPASQHLSPSQILTYVTDRKS